MSDELLSLSLSELRKSLEQRGITMSLPSLSEFVKTGNIAELLGISGRGNRLEIPLVVVDLLAEFLPQYRQAKGRLPQAEGMLRSFLKQRTEGTLIPVSESRTSGELTRYGEEMIQLLSEIAETLKNHVQPPDDALLTMKAAREQFGVPLSVLRGLRVSVGGRKYVRRRDVLKWIEELKP